MGAPPAPTAPCQQGFGVRYRGGPGRSNTPRGLDPLCPPPPGRPAAHTQSLRRCHLPRPSSLRRGQGRGSVFASMCLLAVGGGAHNRSTRRPRRTSRSACAVSEPTTAGRQRRAPRRGPVRQDNRCRRRRNRPKAGAMNSTSIALISCSTSLFVRRATNPQKL